MKTNNKNKKELYESQLKIVLNACLNEHNPQFEYVSGILVGMGYETMADFIDTMNKFYGFSYEVNTIATLYYYADLDNKSKLALSRISRCWFDSELKKIDNKVQ